MTEAGDASGDAATEAFFRTRVKRELRKRMRGVRMASSSVACAERSARIVERLLAHPKVASARAVALFFPIEDRREVDLRGLDAALRARGVRVAYPAIAPDDADAPFDPDKVAPRPMTFRFVEALSELEERGMGFREPSPEAPLATRGALDVVVVPALAVDPSGHRIGYGAGYYDRALPQVAPPATAIAVAFDYQLIAEVPVTEHDVAVDHVVTDAREFAAEPR